MDYYSTCVDDGVVMQRAGELKREVEEGWNFAPRGMGGFESVVRRELREREEEERREREKANEQEKEQVREQGKE